jgi:hypothetical protein
MGVVQSWEGEPVGMPWNFCAFGGHDACITRFYDACALRGWRWGRRDGRYGLNESRLCDFGECFRGIGLGLEQVSARFCLEDPCGGGIVCHGCALSIGHPLNSGGEAIWGSDHHPLLFHPLFCLGWHCAGDVRIEVMGQHF